MVLHSDEGDQLDPICPNDLGDTMVSSDLEIQEYATIGASPLQTTVESPTQREP